MEDEILFINEIIGPISPYELAYNPEKGHYEYMLIDDSKYKDYNDYLEKKNLTRDEIIGDVTKCHFPALKEDGGEVKDLSSLKSIINNSRIESLLSCSCRTWLYIDIHKFMNPKSVEYIRKAIKNYAKISDNPVYQQVIDKYGW